MLSLLEDLAYGLVLLACYAGLIAIPVCLILACAGIITW